MRRTREARGPGRWDDAARTRQRQQARELVLVHRARAALEMDLRVPPHLSRLDLRRGPLDTLVISGEVPCIGIKRRAIACLHRVVEPEFLCDEIRVEPARTMSDGEIAAEIAALGSDGLSIHVRRGVVTLRGNCPSLSDKRLAGVRAWWVPGTREVVNELRVRPWEPPAHARLEPSVARILERDPLVHERAIDVRSRGPIVTLEGSVPRATERALAESDAWYTFGVLAVENQLLIQW